MMKRFLFWGKDGGPFSTVRGIWLIELKSLFSVALLCFEDGSRDTFHSHAFNSISWVLRGRLTERLLSPEGYSPVVMVVNEHTPSLFPIRTHRSTFHKVQSTGRTWVLTFRGPWAKQWLEYLPADERFVTLMSGRKEV